MVNYLT